MIWAPEFAQSEISRLLRAAHVQLHRLGEAVAADVLPRGDCPRRRGAFALRTVLAERAGWAVERIGTSRPSELVAGLRRLSGAAACRRAPLLAGLRLLPLGLWFEAGRDVYPEFVNDWLQLGE